MRSFFIFENKDSGRAYVSALESAGYQRVNKIEQADFILFDVENVGYRREMRAEFIRKNGPAFIYPHTPMTCYIWDGIYEPLPVACNFVAGEGQRKIMQVYGYPSRVEACGFPRCEVLPFRQAKGRNLLFVPARPRRDKGRQGKLDDAALLWILENRGRFEEVVVCRLAGQFEYPDDYMDITWVTTDPKATENPAADMIERIDKADLMISVTTPAALGVARGCPTIMYGQGDPLETITGRRAKNFDKYKSLYAYPLSLEDMSIQDVLNFAMFGCEKVETWKQAHIGGNFDPGRFVEIVRDYV